MSAQRTAKEIDIPYLQRFWERSQFVRGAGAVPTTEREWMLDRVMLNGLGLGQGETADFFSSKRSFSEFLEWIVEGDLDGPDTVQVGRVNEVVAGERPGLLTQAYLAEVDQITNVLSEADLAFWDEHGWVIVRGAVTRAEARAAEAAVWEHLAMSPDQPDSWYDKPIGQGIMTELYRHPALKANRGSLRIRKAFAQLWQTNDLWMTTDRAGFNPPETERYKYRGPRLHWDMSLAPPFEFGTHGVLYLCDVAEDQGAFSCVPGFHRRIESWLKELSPETDPREEALRLKAIPIAANAGDLIIWHHALPHGSSPNRGGYPRIVQYLNMYPAEVDRPKEWL